MRRNAAPQSLKFEPILLRTPHSRIRRDFVLLRSGSSNKISGIYGGVLLALIIYSFTVGSLILYHFDHAKFLSSVPNGDSDVPSLRRMLNSRRTLNESFYSKIAQSASNQTFYSPKISLVSNKLGNATFQDVISNISGQNRHMFNKKISALIYPEDYQKFTVRISIEHYLSCSSVRQIQVIWCLEQGEPPSWLIDAANKANEKIQKIVLPNNSNDVYPSLVIERHAANSLNERFLALTDIPTAGVLSIDDDVIRPCIALDATFLTWTQNPTRQIGFDARSHAIEKSTNNTEIWLYSYMSATEKSNKYSITLTRFSFLHRDYLRSYWTDMPFQVRDMVSDSFNCEDIAMSLWITANTDGQPPLLADYWAVKSQVKIFVEAKISGGKNHKMLRNHCMDFFADLFMLKGRLKTATLYHRRDKHGGLFEYGARANTTNSLVKDPLILHEKTRSTLEKWKNTDRSIFLRNLGQMVSDASKTAYNHGLIENTPRWRDRFLQKRKPLIAK
jgi:glucuronyl/N-acetylglucosaminyl transferase EXT2